MKIAQLIAAFTMFIWLSNSAHATISVPRIEPVVPTASDFIRVRVTTAACDVFTTLGPTDRVLEVSPGLVKMTVRGFSTDDFAQCNNPISNYTYEIGVLPSSTYRFELFRRFELEPTRINLVGTANFTVTGAAAIATQVPALSRLGIAGLCGAMLLAVFGTRRWFAN